MWRIKEFDFEEMNETSHGQFFNEENYVIRWKYRLSVIGKKFLNNTKICGRERCVFFYWQGENAAIYDQGIAALLTVELDKEMCPQVRVKQGTESAAFLSLFNGFLVIHSGQKNQNSFDIK